MSINALKVWRSIDFAVIEKCRLNIPLRQRPSKLVLEIVGQQLALGVIEPSSGGKRLGYTDKSIEQIIELTHGAVTYSQVRAALRALEQEPLFKTVRKSTRGVDGMPGRAPRRVMYLYDPCNWIIQSGLERTLNSHDSSLDDDPFSVRYDLIESGADHTTLQQPTSTSSYTKQSARRSRPGKSSYELRYGVPEPF